VTRVRRSSCRKAGAGKEYHVAIPASTRAGAEVTYNGAVLRKAADKQYQEGDALECRIVRDNDSRVLE
jgi:hypothetical protein